MRLPGHGRTCRLHPSCCCHDTPRHGSADKSAPPHSCLSKPSPYLFTAKQAPTLTPSRRLTVLMSALASPHAVPDRGDDGAGHDDVDLGHHTRAELLEELLLHRCSIGLEHGSAPPTGPGPGRPRKDQQRNEVRFGGLETDVPALAASASFILVAKEMDCSELACWIVESKSRASALRPP